MAAPEARFAANFTKLGFHPGFGLTYTLPWLIGRQAGDLHLRLLHGRLGLAALALERDVDFPQAGLDLRAGRRR